ncbi:MAG TPA: hypothetical protein VGR20_18075 [Acidimicrobiia bacterium]|nr:hypothetical protein [Acidimicrobiia bacterium]
MSPLGYGTEGNAGLQPILSASSALADTGGEIRPHHPVTCSGPLSYDEAGTLACDHASAPTEDRRTQFCVTYSVSLLLIELVNDL